MKNKMLKMLNVMLCYLTYALRSCGHALLEVVPVHSGPFNPGFKIPDPLYGGMYNVFTAVLTPTPPPPLSLSLQQQQSKTKMHF